VRRRDQLRRAAQARLLDLLDAQLASIARWSTGSRRPTSAARRGRAPIRYELDQPPWIASRMQDFFGLARAPAVGDGRVRSSSTCSPPTSARPVTTDLPGSGSSTTRAAQAADAALPKHAWPRIPPR